MSAKKITIIRYILWILANSHPKRHIIFHKYPCDTPLVIILFFTNSPLNTKILAVDALCFRARQTVLIEGDMKMKTTKTSAKCLAIGFICLPLVIFGFRVRNG
jgi:hypothetical protein